MRGRWVLCAWVDDGVLFGGGCGGRGSDQLREGVDFDYAGWYGEVEMYGCGGLDACVWLRVWDSLVVRCSHCAFSAC